MRLRRHLCGGIYSVSGRAAAVLYHSVRKVGENFGNGMLLAQEEAAEAMQGRYAWLYEMAQAQLLQEDLSAQKERTQNYLYTAFCAKRLFGMLK